MSAEDHGPRIAALEQKVAIMQLTIESGQKAVEAKVDSIGTTMSKSMDDLRQDLIVARKEENAVSLEKLKLQLTADNAKIEATSNATNSRIKQVGAVVVAVVGALATGYGGWYAAQPSAQPDTVEVAPAPRPADGNG